jgi:hypothetical protein
LPKSLGWRQPRHHAFTLLGNWYGCIKTRSAASGSIKFNNDEYDLSLLPGILTGWHCGPAARDSLPRGRKLFSSDVLLNIQRQLAECLHFLSKFAQGAFDHQIIETRYSNVIPMISDSPQGNIHHCHDSFSHGLI